MAGLVRVAVFALGICSAVMAHAATYRLGGEVTGLAGQLVLENKANGDRVKLAADGEFRFDDRVQPGIGYLVRVLKQPPGQFCDIARGKGKMPSRHVTNIRVSCINPPAVAPVVAVSAGHAPTQLRFSWDAVEDATRYVLLRDPDGLSGFAELGSTTGSSIDTDIAVHQFEWEEALFRVDACNRAGCTAGMPVGALDAMVDAIGYFKASNTGADDHFGFRVRLSADGNTLVVGAFFEDGSTPGVNPAVDDDDAPLSGAVYVFARSADGWQQQALLKASNAGEGDRFGRHLSLSADGNVLAVGAFWEDSAATGVNGEQLDENASDSGAVYVFRRNQRGTWRQQAYLKASNAEAGDTFGQDVALSGDGLVLAVGAPLEDGSADPLTGINPADNNAADAGAVYVYRLVDGAWRFQAYLKAPNADAGDWFGNGLAINHDGSTLAVGAPLEDSGAAGIDGDDSDNSLDRAGAVYVYTRSGKLWSLQAYLKASLPDDGDQFGGQLALAADGNTLTVSAHLEDGGDGVINGNQEDDSANAAGAVYVFTRANGAWSEQAYLKAANAQAGDFFGEPMALSADGNLLAVGAINEDGADFGVDADDGSEAAANAGAVYLFAREEGNWEQINYIKAPNTRAGAAFGVNVSLSADGGRLAVGASLESSAATGINGDQSDTTAPQAGAVYLY